MIPRYSVILQKWLRIALLWRSNTFPQRRGGGWPSSISCGNVVTILWQTDCRVAAQNAAESETPFLAAGWLRFFRAFGESEGLISAEGKWSWEGGRERDGGRGGWGGSALAAESAVRWHSVTRESESGSHRRPRYRYRDARDRCPDRRRMSGWVCVASVKVRVRQTSVRRVTVTRGCAVVLKKMMVFSRVSSGDISLSEDAFPSSLYFSHSLSLFVFPWR